jgi:hypothetical protein
MLTLFEFGAALQGFPLGDLLPTALRDAHLTYFQLLALIQILSAVKASVTDTQVGGAERFAKLWLIRVCSASCCPEFGRGRENGIFTVISPAHEA